MPVSDGFSDEYKTCKALVPTHWKGTVARLGALAAAGGPRDGHADAVNRQLPRHPPANTLTAFP